MYKSFIVSMLYLVMWPVWSMQPLKVGSQVLATQQEVMGTWMPLKLYPLRASSKAKVVQICLPYGQNVQEGELLFELASPELALDIELARCEVDEKKALYQEVETWQQSPQWGQAQHDLNLATLNYQLKQKQVENAKKLVEMGGLSKEHLIQEELQLSRLNQQRLMAQAQLEKVEKKGGRIAKEKALIAWQKAELALNHLMEQYQDLKVMAPSEGILYAPETFYKVDLNPLALNQEVEKNQWLGVVASLKDFGVTIEVDAQQMRQLEAADEIRVTLPESSVLAHMHSALPKQKATIHTFEVMLRLENTPKKLMFGQKLPVSWLQYHPAQSPVVPLKALHWDKDHTWVYKQNEQGQWSKTSVKLGLLSHPFAQIIEGLEQGDTIGLED